MSEQTFKLFWAGDYPVLRRCHPDEGGKPFEEARADLVRAIESQLTVLADRLAAVREMGEPRV